MNDDLLQIYGRVQAGISGKVENFIQTDGFAVGGFKANVEFQVYVKNVGASIGR